ncbi:flavodoxin domain-containing protein [Amycolatopsis sp. FDAARGOS 1241]|uniref:flavodoxin family protein n=1 Tax=Amycolatopsis sp. FDAARGOS 1241 TaxID=2778070 RepID=UPI00194FA8A1|nr:flavodoxin domain-containing protein [Amycolatopsis sp. FDAARGOS 1241]QRP50217.1 flavodoxin domain-containing protein [Amycolatopsis sp. FDAARGOS 1241]
MHALIVYESLFGDTEEIARAVAEGLGSATLRSVDDAPRDLAGYDLLVVGAPTHVHGLSRPSTRKAAAEQARGNPQHEIGLREWLGGFRVLPPGTTTAAFDTRLAKPRWLTGSAARAASKVLRSVGHPTVVPPMSFFVEVVNGDTRLVDGESARARVWGATLARRLDRTGPGRG